MGRHANPDIRRAFAEFQDTETPTKCNKVRCQHCGFVRAKNTTRQIEHLQECQAYLNSPEAQAHLAQQTQNGPVTGSAGTQGPSSILNGQQPNPNLQVHRRGPNPKRSRDGQPLTQNPIHQQTPQPPPSLTRHLLTTCANPFRQATQQPFLSHAGCGSLAVGPLVQWLAQDGHYTRGYIRFIGQLLAKIRLPQTQNSQFHPMYRVMDLLISALNNMRREMQFFEITATKYGLALGNEPPSPPTRAMLDLLVSASSSSASLLEGMVVLWATEHVRHAFTRQCVELTCHSATALPGNMLAPSAQPSPHPAPIPTLSHFTKPSSPTGRRPRSTNLSTRRAPSSTSSQTSPPRATAKKR
jgi:thiaminase